MPRALSCLLLLLAPCLLAPPRCSPNPSGDPARINPLTVAAYPLNVALDTDLDGRRDTIRVSDLDGDGQLEIVDDLQAAMDLLDDLEGKLLAVEPGTFLPPPTCAPGSACFCRLMPRVVQNGVACWNGSNDPRGHALLQVPSYTTVRCAGSSKTLLALWDYDDPNAPDANYAAIGNSDYANGNRNITIEDCGWRGGGRNPYNSLYWAHIGRRGLDFHNVEDSVVQRNHAADFQHAGIFVESSRRVTIRDNVHERDGGFRNVNIESLRQSSIYLHNDPHATPSSDHLIVGNTLIDPGGNAISLRNDYQDAGKAMERIEIRSNSVISHGSGICIMLRGSRQIRIDDYYCEGTKFGFQLDPTASAFGMGASDDDVSVDGLTLVNVVAPNGSTALYLGPYHSNVSFQNVVVDGTGLGDCVGIRPPFRNVAIRDFTLRNCAGNGIQAYANAVDPSIDVVGRTPDEALVLERGTILDVDAVNRRDWFMRSGILFSTAGARFLTLRDVTIAGVTGHGIEFSPGKRLESSWLEGLDISRVPPGFLGMGTKAALGAPACDAAANDEWVIVSDALDASDCDLSGPAGATTTRCRCEDGVWRRVTNHQVGNMIALRGGLVFDTTFASLFLHDAGSETASYAFRLYGDSATYLGNFFEDIHIADALDGHTWGIRFESSASTTNRFGAIYCEDSAAAHCLEGVPPASP